MKVYKPGGSSPPAVVMEGCMTKGFASVMVALLGWLATAEVGRALDLEDGNSVSGVVKVQGVPSVVYVGKVVDSDGETLKTAAETRAVVIKGQGFNPGLFAQCVNGSIRLADEDGQAHEIEVWVNDVYLLETLIIKSNNSIEYTAKQEGVLVFRCANHEGERANVIVTRYGPSVVTDDAGNFTWKGLPAGKYELKVWNGLLKPNQLEKTYPVTIEGNKANNIEITPPDPDPSGVIRGKVKYSLIKKYPTIVYVKRARVRRSQSDIVSLIDQKNKAFIPHILPIVRNTRVSVINSDDFNHNVHCQSCPCNVNVPPGHSHDYRFRETGFYVHICDIHPEMLAYVAVFDNPFFAVTDRKGNFVIKGVPPGKYELQIWNRKFRRDKKVLDKTFEVTVEADTETTVEIVP